MASEKDGWDKPKIRGIKVKDSSNWFWLGDQDPSPRRQRENKRTQEKSVFYGMLQILLFNLYPTVKMCFHWIKSHRSNNIQGGT